MLFEGRELTELSSQEMDEAFRHFDATELPRAALGTQDAALPTVLAASGLVPSKGQARTAITGGGVYVNNRRVAEPSYVVGEGDLLNGSLCGAAPRQEGLPRGQGPVGAVREPRPYLPSTEYLPGPSNNRPKNTKARTRGDNTVVTGSPLET